MDIGYEFIFQSVTVLLNQLAPLFGVLFGFMILTQIIIVLRKSLGPIENETSIERHATPKTYEPKYHGQDPVDHRPIKGRCSYCGSNPGSRVTCRNCGAPNFWADLKRLRY